MLTRLLIERMLIMEWLPKKGWIINQLVNQLVKDEENDYTRRRVLDYEVCWEQGETVLWTATEMLYKETQATLKIIECIPLGYFLGEADYKWTEEGDFPNYFSCPKRIRDSVPASREEWRERCREWNKETVPC